MFAEKNDKKSISENIANYLTDHKRFKTHNRHINRDEAKSIGLLIDDLETDQTFQDLILSVFHATTHTFTGAGTVKIIENHLGRAYLKQQQIVQFTPQANQPTALPSSNLPTDQR